MYSTVNCIEPSFSALLLLLLLLLFVVVVGTVERLWQEAPARIELAPRWLTLERLRELAIWSLRLARSGMEPSSPFCRRVWLHAVGAAQLAKGASGRKVARLPQDSRSNSCLVKKV